MGWFFLGLVIGLLVGAGAVYWLQRQTIAQQGATLQQSRQRINQLEQEHDRRLQMATDQLRRDYEAQLASQKEQSARELVALRAELAAATVTASQPVMVETGPTEVLSSASTASGAEMPEVEMSAVGGSEAMEAPPPNSLSQAAIGSSVAVGSPRPSEDLQVAWMIRDQLAMSPKALTPQSLAALQRLLRSRDAAVRLAAVEAMGQVRSHRVLPLLKKSLNDTDPLVVQAANQVISKFKGTYPRPQSKTKKRLPKNR